MTAAAKSALWAHKNFLRLWSAQAVSALGSRVSRTAIPVVAIVAISASPIEVAALSAMQLLPAIAIGALVGGAIERARKKRLLIAADVLRALLLLTVPLAAFAGALTMAQLYVVTFAVGACSSAFRISDNAFLPALIEKEDLVDGNSKLETTESLAEIGGPSLAGVLIAAIGAPLALLADVGTFLWSALVLSRIDADEEPPKHDADGSTVSGDFNAGFRAGFHDPLLAPTFYSLCIQSLFFGFFIAMYMLFALEVLAVDIAALGFVIALGGVGAFVGAVSAKPLLRRLGLGRALLMAALFGQSTYLLIPLAEMWPAYKLPLLCAQQLVGDAWLIAFMILATSFRQARLPADMMARATGALEAIGGVLLVVGAVAAGIIATIFSVSVAVWVAALGGLVAALPLLSPRLLGTREVTDADE